MEQNALSYSKYSRLVAVECTDDGKIECFQRNTDGNVHAFTEEFRPWLLTANTQLATMLGGNCGIEELSGPGAMHALVWFPDSAAYDAALKLLKDLTGVTPSAPNAPYRVFSDSVQQAMIMQQLRLFHEMEFEELVRLQLDIECHSDEPGQFCDATKPNDVITMISLKVSTGHEECLTLKECGSEKALLETAIAHIQQYDPDVIEGHNIFNFDLDYIEKRCKRNKVAFALGRGGKLATARASVLNIAERRVNYRRYNAYGRHIVDTYHLVMLADVSRRDMENYKLKYCAKYYGINREDRVYIAGEDISALCESDLARVKEYCLDDVRETDGLSRIISPSWFYQTRLLPLSYQNCIVRGNATRIDGMLCAEYLIRRATLPAPSASLEYTGALSEAAQTGVFSPVWHIDVRSLYPSVILAGNWHPASDHLGIFLEKLRKLREVRLAAKDAARNAKDPAEKAHYNALQSSFKILINSFYGYLGFSQGTFNDYQLASKVTSTGRQILASMNAELEREGASVVEMDTDGIYFVPPHDINAPETLRERVQSALPTGIEIELDGIFDAMFCYKSKNYALREKDGRISLHGAALRSRGLEPFQRRFVREVVELRLAHQDAQIDTLYEKYCEDIEQHRFPLDDFMKREYLTQNTDAYKKALDSGKGKRAAVYEVALRAKKPLKSGDSVTYYVTGNKKSVSVADFAKSQDEASPDVRDENIPFYLDKLKGLYLKLRE